MEDWIDRLAESLGEERLSMEETNRLLSSAREVAHLVERKITPLATFLMGAAVGRRLAGGAPRGETLEAALQTVGSLLPQAPTEVSE